MKIEYLKHAQVDKRKWDDCVLASPDGCIYALSWYLDIVAPEWDALVKVSFEDQYDIVMPVTHFRKAVVFKIIRQPYFANQLGLMSVRKVSETDFQDFISKIINKYHFVSSYPLNTGNQQFVKQIRLPLQISVHHSYELSLSPSYDELYESFTVNRKRNIKKASKSNLGLSVGSIDDLIPIHRIFAAPRLYGGVSEHQYHLLHAIYGATKERGCGEVYNVTSNGMIIGSAFFLFFKNRIIKFIHVTTDEGRRQDADSFMMDRLLRQWSNTDRILDFERESSAGVNAYKESYGPNVVEYSSLTINRLPAVIRLLRKVRMSLIRKGTKSSK